MKGVNRGIKGKSFFIMCKLKKNPKKLKKKFKPFFMQ